MGDINDTMIKKIAGFIEKTGSKILSEKEVKDKYDKNEIGEQVAKLCGSNIWETAEDFFFRR